MSGIIHIDLSLAMEKFPLVAEQAVEPPAKAVHVRIKIESKV
jgi:hypothetical protein